MFEFQEEEWVRIEDVERAMDRVLNSSKTHLTRYVFSVNDFFQYLILDDLNGPLKTQVHQDMTAPLQHYFIYTGHNSYLTGNQLSSDCSEVPIIKALQRGVRAIELDLWPSSSKDRIHVLHGRTLTTPVTLKKCLKSIKEHAFVNSPYPVIITLEDHLTPNLQAKVAEMVTSIFGDMLYFPKASDKEEFPSPDALKYHIILSTKPPKEYLQSKNKKGSSPDKDSSDEELEDQQSQSDQDEDNERYSASDRYCASDINIASSSTSQPLSEILGVDYENDDIKDENFGHQAAPENKHLHASKPKNGTKKMLRNETGKPKRFSVSEPALDSESSSTSQPLSEILGVDYDNDDFKDEKFGHQAATENKHLDASKPINGTRKMLRNETGKPKRLSVTEPALDSESSSTTQPLSEILGVDYEDDDIEDEKFGHQAAPEYKHLIAIHASKPKNGTRKALRDEPGKAKRLSVSEQALEKAANLYGADIVRFTQKYILRVFPKGTRVTSTNFRPLTAWMHGAQMVAFNMQGYGRSLWMMHGMFRSNGGCGYVRKPDFLMDKGPDGEVFDPKAKSLPVKKTLKVKIYMGDGWRLDFSQTHFDAFSPPDFYTKIYMAGVPVDVAKKRTKVIGDDWTPIWNEEFTFPLRVPELALLEIVVQEYDVDRDDFAGQACLPVSELRPGIRVVPLYNKKGEKFKHVKLLMRFLFV